MKKEVEITVVCVAYNHVNYIERVIQGIINQKVNVPFEVIIHDDASTDGTAQVIQKYAKQYPDLITVILQKENQYSKGINVRKEYVHPLVRGKYYAWTEGDDIWIYDGKLQAQYDFMESHPECALCYHNAINFDAEEDIESLLVVRQPSGYLTDEQIICCPNGNYPTTAVFARADDMLRMPEEFYNASITDHPTRYYMATRGKVYYINRVWAIRNYNHPASWTHAMQQSNERYKEYCLKYTEFLCFFNTYSKGRFFKDIRWRCMGNLIGHFLIEPYEKMSCAEWEELARDYYSRLPKEARIVALEELIEDGMTRCRDYDTCVARDVVKQYIEKGKRLYIYGAGMEAYLKALALVQQRGVYEGFVVSDISDQPEIYMGRPIYEFAKMRFKENDVVWLGLNRRNKDAVIPMLEERNINYISR